MTTVTKPTAKDLDVNVIAIRFEIAGRDYRIENALDMSGFVVVTEGGSYLASTLAAAMLSIQTNAVTRLYDERLEESMKG